VYDGWGPEVRQDLRNLCSRVGIELDVFMANSDEKSGLWEQDEVALLLSEWEYQWL
jgi:hypothetical protein